MLIPTFYILFSSSEGSSEILIRRHRLMKHYRTIRWFYNRKFNISHIMRWLQYAIKYVKVLQNNLDVRIHHRNSSWAVNCAIARTIVSQNEKLSLPHIRYTFSPPSSLSRDVRYQVFILNEGKSEFESYYRIVSHFGRQEKFSGGWQDEDH